MYNHQQYMTTIYINSDWSLVVETPRADEESHIFIGKFQDLDCQDIDGNWIAGNLGRYVWVDDIKPVILENPKSDSEITRKIDDKPLLEF